MIYTATKLYPWHMAQLRKTAVTTMTLHMLWSTAFINMWAECMWPSGVKK